MRVVAHEDALTLAARDSQVGAATERAAVRNENSASTPTPGLAGIGDAELCVAQVERGATSNRSAIEVSPGWIVDDDIRWRTDREVGVEALYVNDSSVRDSDADLHVANGGGLHRDVPRADKQPIMEKRACRVLKQGALDVHVGDVDDTKRGKPRVAGGDASERNLAALKDKDLKDAGAVDGEVAELDINAVPSNPNVAQCGCPRVNGEPIDGDAARSLNQ